MQESSWSQALTEIVQAVVATFVRFWKQDMVQVLLTVGMFLALALPLLLVVLLLWYLDATGWRPSSGFYTIGMAQESQPLAAAPMVAGLTLCGTLGPVGEPMATGLKTGQVVQGATIEVQVQGCTGVGNFS